MALTKINNQQISSAVTGNVSAGIDASTKIQDHSVTSAQIANSIALSGNVAAGNILTNNYFYANGVPFVSSNYGNANVADYLSAGALGDIIPQGNNLQSLGNATNQWSDLWVSNATIYFNGYPLSGNATTLTFNSLPLVMSDANGNITTTGNISSGHFVGNGSTLSSLTGANVAGEVASANVVTNPSQPVITAVGVLTSLTANAASINGQLTANGNAQFNGDVYFAGNVSIPGNINVITGNSGQFYGNTQTGFDALYAGLPAGYTLLPQEVTQFSTNFDGYAQVSSHNINSGASATSDYVATADNGTDTTNYIDMGIASSGYDGLISTNSLGNSLLPNDGYLYTQGNVVGGNLVLGSIRTGGVVRIITGASDIANVRATFSATGLSVAGNVIATNFIGDGSLLSNINGANISGTVANATYATTAGVAYSVSAANISGTVANANYSLNSNSSTFAGTAFSVDGANVSGAVANATYANTADVAYSVAVANVSGIGNIATVNLNGNTSTVLAGDGSWIVPAAGYSDANVSAYLAGGSDTANIITTGNISGTYILGNGSQLTGLPTLVASANSFYVATNGNDIVGTGSVYNPFKTIGKAVSVAGNFSQIILNPGDYIENIVLANVTSMTITNTGSGTTDLYGNLTISGTTSGLDLQSFGIHGVVTHSGTGTAYFTQINLGTTSTPATVIKSGSGQLEFINCDLQTGAGATTVTVTGSGPTTFTNTKLWNLTVSNANATVSAFGSPGVVNTTLTAGSLNLFQSLVFPFVTGGNAITATGGVLNMKNSGILNPNLTPAKINLSAGTVFAYDDINFDRANSSLGFSANVLADFQSIRALNISTGNIASTGTVSATGNITGSYFIGNGSQLTGLPASYGDSNVSAYLASGTDTANIITTGNVIAGNIGNVATYLYGDGSNITGLPSGYTDANVSTYLASGTDTANIITSGNIQGASLLGDGYYITNVNAVQVVNGTSNVTVPTANGNIVATTNGINQWVFDTSGNLVLPPQNVGASTVNGTPGESTVLKGNRKIVNGVYSGATNPFTTELAPGGTATAVYTASNQYVYGVKITFAVQSTGIGFNWEQFDVMAIRSTDVPGEVNFVVSNRVKAMAIIPDTIVTATLNSNTIEISLNLAAGQTNGGWASFDATEFGLMVD